MSTIEINTSGFMPSVSIAIEGKEKAVQALERLETKLQKKILLRVIRKSAKPLIRRARSLTPRGSFKPYISAHRHIVRHVQVTKLVKHSAGELARSIGVYLPKRRSNMAVAYIGPRTKSVTQANNGWYGHFVELGTRGYTVKKDKVVVFPNGGVATIKAGTHIPGQKAHPFMGPAWEQTKRQVMNNFDHYLEIELKNIEK